jgi:hypothetical protein
VEAGTTDLTRVRGSAPSSFGETALTAPAPRPESSAWAAEQLGGPCRFHWRGSAVEGSRVWTASSGSGRQAFLKEPSSLRKHEQEARALTEWSPRIPGVMPRLLAAKAEPPALLIEALPGLGGERAMRSFEIELAAHRAAGAALGRLHAIETPDPDPMPLAEALPRRLQQWLVRATRALPAATRASVREAFGDGSAFAGLRRRPCHRDVEPRNWLVELDESRLLALRLVDFEHARPDLVLSDFVKLECGAWEGREELRSEFFEGHGAGLDAQGEDQLRRLVLLHLVATCVRATEDDDVDGARRARESLERRLPT